MAFIEGWGTCLLIFCFGAGASGLTMQTQSQFASTLYAALFNFTGLTLFIYSAAPASGGHLNPTITISTFFAGLCTFPRMILYVTAQCVGAIVGSYWLRLGLGDHYFPQVRTWIPYIMLGCVQHAHFARASSQDAPSTLFWFLQGSCSCLNTCSRKLLFSRLLEWVLTPDRVRSSGQH